MNRALVKRLLNEYLDGEIGLADKVELERLMAEDPAVRAEYKELRQLGLLLGALPEVTVHPQRFRGRMQDALDGPTRFFTPQRTFAGAMIVTLLVIALSFGLLVFQQNAAHTGSAHSVEAAGVQPTGPASYIVALDTGVDAQRFFSRVMVESQLGMIDAQALAAVVAQTSVFEGASCTDDAMNPLRLANPRLPALRLNVSPSVAAQLSRVAEELTGRAQPLTVYGGTRARLSMEGYLRLNPGCKAVALQLKFR
jgi:hypothetical protein